jgi:hypothetical protein
MDSFALPIVIVGIALAFVGIPNLQEKWKTLPKTPGPSLEPVKDLNKDKWTYCEANECFPIRLKELSQERIAFTVLRTNSDLIFEWNLAGKRYWKVGSTSGKVKFYKSSKGVYFGAVQSSNRQHWGPFYLTRVGNFRGFQRDLMEVSERYLEEWEWCSSDSCIPAKMDFLNDERMVFVTRTTLGNGWRKNTRYHKCVWEQAGQGYCHLSTDANKERGEMEMRKVSAGHFVGILRSGQNRRHFQLTRKYHYD